MINLCSPWAEDTFAGLLMALYEIPSLSQNVSCAQLFNYNIFASRRVGDGWTWQRAGQRECKLAALRICQHCGWGLWRVIAVRHVNSTYMIFSFYNGLCPRMIFAHSLIWYRYQVWFSAVAIPCKIHGLCRRCLAC